MTITDYSEQSSLQGVRKTDNMDNQDDYKFARVLHTFGHFDVILIELSLYINLICSKN